MGPDRDEEIDSTRRSWDRATRQHNAHKGDQAAAIKKNELLFPEEIALLGKQGPGKTELRKALLMLTVFMLWAAAHLLMGARTYRRDLAAKDA